MYEQPWICRYIKNFATKIPLKHIKILTSRSSGPGGQSVNKSETKVQARFNVEQASWMQSETKDKFRQLFKQRITQAGDFIVESDEFASQEQNKKACINKLNEAITKAEKYEPEVQLTFLEQIYKNKSVQQIEQYHKKRREDKRKEKRIGHKTITDF